MPGPGRAILPAIILILSGCGQEWNNPYPAAESGKNILYSSFTDRPKHLDPAQSYASDEWEFTSQIYEPPLQYHYLKRPYELIPQTAAAMPRPRYFDSGNRELAAGTPAERIAYSEYEIRIRPGILYQPHPAFAKDEHGRPLYLDLSEGEIGKKHAGIFAYMSNEIFSFPHETDGIFASTIGKNDWIAFMAFNHDVPVGAASVCITGDTAYLSFANVLPAYRRRGVQSALLAKRVDAARERGVKWIVVDTAENSDEHPNPSYWNMLRHGFRLLYNRPNYVKINPE